MATKYDINYNDKRFTEVEADKKAALNEVDVTYGNMISSSDKYYQDQINASKDYAETQKKNQQAQTDFAIEKIEQQKEQAHTDYIKEQSGAYVDWQKQSNPYGAEAEKRASAGLAGTGYAESSLVGMYNAYQNRVATAREVYNRAVLNYENAINEARLQNNAQLAEIAYNALQQQLQLSLQGFQYKNQLLLEKAATKREVDNTYYGRYKDVEAQINHEHALAEQVRQMKEIAIAQAAKASSSSKNGSSYSRSSYVKKQTNDEKKIQKAESKNKSTVSASQYLNQLIKSGASKDKVSNEIAIALREGAITKAEAQKLRNTFTPRGLAY